MNMRTFILKNRHSRVLNSQLIAISQSDVSLEFSVFLNAFHAFILYRDLFTHMFFCLFFFYQSLVKKYYLCIIEQKAGV